MIGEELIEKISSRLKAGKLVHEALPGGGLIHIDKLLPYMCMYRFKDREDLLFSGLIKTQAAYLIAPAHLSLTHLLEALARQINKELNAYLLLELWPGGPDRHIRILSPRGKSPATVAALEKGFSDLGHEFESLPVQVEFTQDRHPSDLKPLFTVDESKMTGTLVIGVSFPVIYRDSDSGKPYSLYYRMIRSQFSTVIKTAVYEFIRVQTANPFHHYLMLGKTNLNALSKKVDRELARISEELDFLLRITPVNALDEWQRFAACSYERPPAFTYRLIAIDPELIKRDLYDIPVEKVDDPTLAFVFREKRMEIEKQLTMLEERGTDSFRFIGQSLYGVPRPEVIRTARDILTRHPEDTSREIMERMDASQFARRARIEMQHYKDSFPLPFSMEIRKDVAGIMVSKGNLLISEDLSLDSTRCEALLQHEIGTHMLTYGNGRNQPLHQLYVGLAGYDNLQEGLAVFSEYLVNGLTINRLRLLAGRVVASEQMIRGADFITTFNSLRLEFGFSGKVAFYITMRVFRGGGLAKDALYLSGLIDLLEYLRKGGDLPILYTGKFNINHVDLIEELLHRSVLQPPSLPHFFDRKEVRARSQKAAEGMEVLDLLQS